MPVGEFRDRPFLSKVDQKGVDFKGAHLSRMALVVKEEQTLHPIPRGFFGVVGIVFETDSLTELSMSFFP